MWGLTEQVGNTAQRHYPQARLIIGNLTHNYSGRSPVFKKTAHRLGGPLDVDGYRVLLAVIEQRDNRIVLPGPIDRYA